MEQDGSRQNGRHTDPPSPTLDEEKEIESHLPRAESESKPYQAQDWTGPDDPDCPQNWSITKRVYLTSVGALYCFVVTFSSSIYTSGLDDVERRFSIGPVTALLGLALFVWGLAFGPVLAAPLSENYGRRIVYLASFPVFALFTLGAGLARNFATLAICRFLAGVFGSPVLAVSAGTIADIWPPKYTGSTFPFLSMAPFVGPTMGPVIGGFVAAHKDFRWLQWTILFALVGVYLYSLPMPETYKPEILRRRAKRLGLPPPPSRTPNGLIPATRFFFAVTILKPIKMLFTESIVVLFTIWISFNFAVIYGFFSAFPYVFETAYSFDGPQVGLTFLSLCIGVILGCFTSVAIDRFTYPKLSVRFNGKVPPEYRLITAMAGAILNPISLFWFGWTAENRVFWACPTVAAVWFGAGNVMVYISGAMYFLDAYGGAHGASALSANGLGRYIAGGAFPLFTAQMYRGLGIGWASSLLGFVSVALVPLPFLFYYYGPRIRAKSHYIDSPVPNAVKSENR